MAKYFYRASSADFLKIPGSPIAYWVGPHTLAALADSELLGEIGDARMGLATGENAKYVRAWHEVSFQNIGLSVPNRFQSKESGLRWFPYCKGGQYRKWFGNNEYVVDWFNDGEELQRRLHPSGHRTWAHNFNLDNIFRDSLTWSDITSGTLSVRYNGTGFLFDGSGTCAFFSNEREKLAVLGLLNSRFANDLSKILNPTMHFQTGDFSNIPFRRKLLDDEFIGLVSELISIAKWDWNEFENSWEYDRAPLVKASYTNENIRSSFTQLVTYRKQKVDITQRLEENCSRFLVRSYDIESEFPVDIRICDVTLSSNPKYRYGNDKSEALLSSMQQCDIFKELVSYAIGCMMGRYSLDKPGLILASHGETLHDYLQQIPSPSFAPDDDAILPLTDQEWFTDDATNRFREFVRGVWGDEHLQENLDFVAESLCLHAINPKRGESSLDAIRRYLSTQFFKDHLRTYKKRPIYWLFSSGKHKAFECLVYLHRYNESTLSRMRTEYVIPLTAKMTTYAKKLKDDIDASTNTTEKKRLERELDALHKQQAELSTFDEKLRHFADQRISLDLDDGVKVNYGKFGDLLAEVKAVTGDKSE